MIELNIIMNIFNTQNTKQTPCYPVVLGKINLLLLQEKKTSQIAIAMTGIIPSSISY